MPKFKHPETGNVIEVDEDRAVQVLRPQKFYIEVNDIDVPSPPRKKARRSNKDIRNT